MRLSDERIKSLQALLEELYGLDYTDEQAQEAGLAIMRFKLAKIQRAYELTKHEGNDDGQLQRIN